MWIVEQKVKFKRVKLLEDNIEDNITNVTETNISDSIKKAMHKGKCWQIEPP